jgi:hypothetical protein
MKRILLTLVSLTLLLGLGMMYPLGHATARTQCYDPDLVALGNEIVRDSTLCVSDQEVRAEIRAQGLTSGNAYTFWFAYVDDPSQCTGGGAGVCAPPDFGTTDPPDPTANPLGVFGRLDSTVADKDGKENRNRSKHKERNVRENFSGRIGGLRLSSGSLVILLLYDHKMARTTDNLYRARQLLTPQDPFSGAPGLGVVADGAQFTPAAIVIFNLP